MLSCTVNEIQADVLESVCAGAVAAIRVYRDLLPEQSKCLPFTRLQRSRSCSASAAVTPGVISPAELVMLTLATPESARSSPLPEGTRPKISDAPVAIAYPTIRQPQENHLSHGRRLNPKALVVVLNQNRRYNAQKPVIAFKAGSPDVR
jgi:hypothetical protein